MFVMNCAEDSTQTLTFPVPKNKSGKNKSKNNGSAQQFNNEDHPDEVFHPVKCNQCSTEVAVYDSEEVYHFFNVLASHS